MAALALEYAIRSDVGRRRNNEDAVYASPRLAAVADGVGGALRRLTRDDSFVQYMVDGGHLTLEQARRHPSRSLVVEALDGRPERHPTTDTVAARAGDRLLLCSDGLSDSLSDEDLAALLNGHPDRRACADRLVQAALAAGARDNVSVVVADVVPRRALGPAWPPTL